MNRRRLLILVLVVAACSGEGSPTPGGPTQLVLRLPGQTAEPGLVGCGGVVDYTPPFRLHGDPEAEPPVWAGRDDEERVEITWPMGFYATFGPNLHVHSPDGAIVASEGAIIEQTAWRGLVICYSEVYVEVYWLSELDNG